MYKNLFHAFSVCNITMYKTKLLFEHVRSVALIWNEPITDYNLLNWTTTSDLSTIGNLKKILKLWFGMQVSPPTLFPCNCMSRRPGDLSSNQEWELTIATKLSKEIDNRKQETTKRSLRSCENNPKCRCTGLYFGINNNIPLDAEY